MNANIISTQIFHKMNNRKMGEQPQLIPLRVLLYDKGSTINIDIIFGAYLALYIKKKLYQNCTF